MSILNQLHNTFSAAEIIGVSRAGIQRWVSAGEFPPDTRGPKRRGSAAALWTLRTILAKRREYQGEPVHLIRDLEALAQAKDSADDHAAARQIFCAGAVTSRIHSMLMDTGLAGEVWPPDDLREALGVLGVPEDLLGLAVQSHLDRRVLFGPSAREIQDRADRLSEWISSDSAQKALDEIRQRVAALQDAEDVAEVVKHAQELGLTREDVLGTNEEGRKTA